MSGTHTRAWQRWAEREPHYAVLTQPEYRSSTWDEQTEAAFFATGDNHADVVLSALAQRDFVPTHVLDYGCGVGRVSSAFARRGLEVLGIDIAAPMLEIAAQQPDAPGAAVYALAEDALDALPPYDLLHCVLVLQHMPTPRGMSILRRLLANLAPDGAIYLQIPIDEPGTPWWRRAKRLAARVPYLVPIWGKLTGQRHLVAPMEMHAYSLNALCVLLQADGFSDVHIDLAKERGLTFATLMGVRRQSATRTA